MGLKLRVGKKEMMIQPGIRWQLDGLGRYLGSAKGAEGEKCCPPGHYAFRVSVNQP